MDSQKRDEARDRRREEALARRVGDALDQLTDRDADDCPDAELIAAYHEKSLQPDEIARCENHFAVCGRCRKILAVLAAAVEAPLSEQEVAHLGELVAAARTPARTSTPRTEPVRLRWRVRWLAPALGVAAVLAVWFAMRPPWRTADKDTSGILIAQAPKSEPSPSTETRAAEQFSEAIPKKKSETDAVPLKDRPAARAQSTSPPTDALAKNRFDDNRVVGGVAPSSGDAVSTPRDEKKQKTDLKGAPASGASGGAFGARAAALPAPGPPPPAAPPAPRPSKSALGSPREGQVQAGQQAPMVAVPPFPANRSVVDAETAPSAPGTGNGTGSGAGKAPAQDRQALTAPVATDKIAPPPPPALPAPAAGPPEPLPQAQGKAQAPSQPPSDTETPRSTSQTVTVTEAAPLVDTTNSTLSGTVSNNTVRDLPMNGRNFQALARLGVTGELPVQVKTPSGTILWRAGMGGKIQRSADAGRTWILQKSPLQEEWLAGAAISDTMCWVVGRKGAIARTTDGGTWKKVAPPRLAVDSSGKYPDWISITAGGVQTATIAASDQRRYVTQDGGKTWRAMQ
jgi:hypothetical protein